MGKETVSEGSIAAILTDVQERFSKARLYVITCPPPSGGEGYDAMVEEACEGGADVVQFRDKLFPVRERFAAAVPLRAICAQYNVLFIVNDSLDIALAVNADGVHLGQNDLPVPQARQIIRAVGRREFLIGCSTHSLQQALEAEQQSADYIGVGPVFATPTKPSYNPVGLTLVKDVSSHVRIPQVAIGGIDVSNAGQVLEAGAKRIAVVRAVCGAPKIVKAAKEMKALLNDYEKNNHR
jgi:thiamine-phosphate pyrophosphorylase